jgi:hypothetical protein
MRTVHHVIRKKAHCARTSGGSKWPSKGRAAPQERERSEAPGAGKAERAQTSLPGASVARNLKPTCTFTTPQTATSTQQLRKKTRSKFWPPFLPSGLLFSIPQVVSDRIRSHCDRTPFHRYRSKPWQLRPIDVRFCPVSLAPGRARSIAFCRRLVIQTPKLGLESALELADLNGLP